MIKGKQQGPPPPSTEPRYENNNKEDGVDRAGSAPSASPAVFADYDVASKAIDPEENEELPKEGGTRPGVLESDGEKVGQVLTRPGRRPRRIPGEG